MPVLQWWWERKDLRLWALRQQQRDPDLKVGLMVCIREGNEGQDITDNFVPGLDLPDSPPLSFLGLWPQVCGLSSSKKHSVGVQAGGSLMHAKWAHAAALGQLFLTTFQMVQPSKERFSILRPTPMQHRLLHVRVYVRVLSLQGRQACM